MSQKQNDQIYFQMYKFGFETKSGSGGGRAGTCVSMVLF